MQDHIALNNVGHYFETPTDRIDLFQQLSFTIQAGSSTAITGPSGAGKSSLLTLAAGLEQPKSGEIRICIDGQAVSGEQLRANSGFIFQQFHLMRELDALGNLALPLRLKGHKQAFEIAADWLDKVGLSKRAKHKPAALSGGEQQRIAIARAFVSRPSFIFADEPTGNLDEKTSSAITDLMFGFAEETGAALMIVTHSPTLASRATSCYRLAQGRLECMK